MICSRQGGPWGRCPENRVTDQCTKAPSQWNPAWAPQTPARPWVSHLTVRLTEANSAVSQLSAKVSSHQQQTRKLLSLLEGRGLDPLSGGEVMTQEPRMSNSRAAAERTRAITEYLNRQSARHTEIQTSLREKREDILCLLSGDIIDTRFLATSPVPTGIGELLPHSCN